MKDLRSDLTKLIHRFSPQEGLGQEILPGVRCIKVSETHRREKNQWSACLAIIAQGEKEIVLDRKVYRLGEAHYTAAPIHLPVISRVAVATKEKPFLGILVNFDPLVLNEVVSQFEKVPTKENLEFPRPILVGKANEKMLEAFVRLAKLFGSPEEARVLGPLIVKEIFYHFLKGPDGPALRQFLRSGSKTHKISGAIHALRSELNEEINVAALAKNANMSRSAFFKAFKEVTTMSPIQYQKRLRLLEAKRLMIEQGETAEGSAFAVGYKSASQFSREYSRMFGSSPSRNVTKQSDRLSNQ
jgi:AraC-like DNA-binding protein